MEGHCSTGQSPQWAVVPMEEEEDIYDMIYLLIAIGLTPGGDNTVNIYKQTISRTSQ